MPRRGAIALALTTLGLVLLLSFKTPDSPATAFGGSRRQLTAGGPTATPAPVVHSAEPTPGRSTGAGPSAPPATPAPTSTPATGARTADGPVVQTRYGDVQVEVKLDGTKLTDVVALTLPNDRFRSQEISQYVEPILHDEALQAQSAQIDVISGATYTSEAYAQSLQAALDQAHG